ncbi:MAG: DUF421 domain-containing protein [Acetobacteraceae bacterium]|nr:DUF421 domain-containing protein [Acetobacteraceae bacterium]
MEHLFGRADELGWVALKALLLYLAAVFALRLGQRRTLADLSVFDFVAAVAVGSVVGRLPSARDSSFLDGVATLAAVLAAHWCLARLRRFPALAGLLERQPRLLVAHGEVLDCELRRCGLTREDLAALLRQRGVGDPAEARFVVFERRGQVSVIQGGGAGGAEPELVRAVAPQRPAPGA